MLENIKTMLYYLKSNLVNSINNEDDSESESEESEADKNSVFYLRKCSSLQDLRVTPRSQSVQNKLFTV